MHLNHYRTDIWSFLKWQINMPTSKPQHQQWIQAYIGFLFVFNLCFNFFYCSIKEQFFIFEPLTAYEKYCKIFKNNDKPFASCFLTPAFLV